MTKDTVLITGASMGLGAEFARQLAARGAALYLTARRLDLLEALAAELRESCRVRVEVFACDLAAPGAAQRVEEWIQGFEAGLRPNWLVNNAGFGDHGCFGRMEPERVRDMVAVNAGALTELTSRLLPAIKAAPRGTGRILNVGSLAGFQPLPWFAVYAATKAFVLSLSEGLAEELGDSHGIRVTCICPGPVKTSFGVNNSIPESLFEGGQSAVEVVRMALRASDRGAVVVPTTQRLRTFAGRLAPRALVRRIAGHIIKGYARKSGVSLED